MGEGKGEQHKTERCGWCMSKLAHSRQSILSAFFANFGEVEGVKEFGIHGIQEI